MLALYKEHYWHIMNLALYMKLGFWDGIDRILLQGSGFSDFSFRV